MSTRILRSHIKKTAETKTTAPYPSRVKFTLDVDSVPSKTDERPGVHTERLYITVTFPDGRSDLSRRLETLCSRFSGCMRGLLDGIHDEVRSIERDLLVEKGLWASTSQPKSIEMSRQEVVQLIAKHLAPNPKFTEEDAIKALDR